VAVEGFIGNDGRGAPAGLPGLDAVDALPAQAIPGFLAHLAALQLRAAVRLGAPDEGPARGTEPDALLDVNEAAKRLGTSVDWLYRHAAGLPFTRRLSERQLRFSSTGIEQYIRRRMS
jgi:predicted DNA-binding transcriptional regulator AlpA